MQISEMRVDDLGQIAILERECFEDAWSYLMLCNSYEGNFVGFCAREGSAIIAYIGALFIDTCADIIYLAVEKNHRRQGCAGELLNALIGKLKNLNVAGDAALQGASPSCVSITDIFLEVRVSNAAAINLYKKFNFEIIDTRKKYYQNGEDAFIMRLCV